MTRMVCVVIAGLGFSACNPNSIGRPCVNPRNSIPGDTQISTPALECPSRLCLIQKQNASTPGNTDGGTGVPGRFVCTARCEDDSDCEKDDSAIAKGRPGFC